MPRTSLDPMDTFMLSSSLSRLITQVMELLRIPESDSKEEILLKVLSIATVMRVELEHLVEHVLDEDKKEVEHENA